jgi:soluble lytic murein transglycosylase-like protein
MLVTSFALLATLLPAIATHGQPVHIRHRHIAVRQSQEDHTPLAARSNEAHAAAHRAIKRTVNKRGQQCRPRGQSKPNFSSAAPSSASSVAPQSSAPAQTPDAVAAVQVAPSSSVAPPASSQDSWQPAASDASSAAPAPSPSPSPSADSGDGGNTAHWGVLAVTDGNCGWSGASDQEPNGSEDWLNCGINGGGWNPPHVTIDQLVAAELDASGVFAPCAAYIDKFKQYGNEFNIYPIMLASFAMQESTCNPSATGGNGEAGLMQIAPPNCEAGHNCWDVDYNIRRGAQLFRQMIDAKGGNVIGVSHPKPPKTMLTFQAIGAYNGWQYGMTVSSATAAKWQGNCFAQNNLDYLYQYCNGWMQNKNAHSMGTYCKFT